MKCPNCGNETQPNAVFCDQCGTKLADAMASQAQAPAPEVVEPSLPDGSTQASAASEPPMPVESVAPPPPPAPEAVSEPKAPVAPTPPPAPEPVEPVAPPPLPEPVAVEPVAPPPPPEPEPVAPVAPPPPPAPVNAAEPVGSAHAPAVSEPQMPAPPEPSLCPGCGATLTPGEVFCSECGTPVAGPEPDVAPPALVPVAAPAGANACPDCGAALVPGEAYCPSCGAEVGKPAPVAPTPVAPPAPEPVAPPTAPAPEPVAPAAPAPAPAPAAEPVCPSCGAKVAAGDAFCGFCGAALAGAAAPAAPVAPAPAPAPVAAPVSSARLVVDQSNVELPLSAGVETIVGREDPYSGVFPDVDLTPHGGEDGGVSRRHFRIRLTAGQYTIEDLNSTNFTMVNKKRLTPGQPVTLADGDEIRAGRVKLFFKVSS